MSTAPIIWGEQRRLDFEGIDLAATALDAVEFAVPHAAYIVRRVTVYSPSEDLSASPATLGVFTAAAAGGTAVVALSALTALDGTSDYTDLTIEDVGVLTAASLFVHVGTAHGSAATAKVVITLEAVL